MTVGCLPEMALSSLLPQRLWSRVASSGIPGASSASSLYLSYVRWTTTNETGRSSMMVAAWTGQAAFNILVLNKEKRIKGKCKLPT